MTNLINFNRDMFWVFDPANVAPVSGNFSAATLSVGRPAFVVERVYAMQTDFFATTTALTVQSAGVQLLPPPEGDSVPYRVKGYCSGPNQCIWSCGFDDGAGVVSSRRAFGAGHQIDEVVVVPPVDSANPEFGKPMCFFGSVLNEVAGFAQLSISVQRLIAMPPQFAAAMS